MHDHDDLDFAMLTPPTRPGPCKAAAAPEQDCVSAKLEREQVKAAFLRPAEAATAPEVDPVAKRLERARQAAEHIAVAAEAKALACGALPCNALSIRNQVRKHEMGKARLAREPQADCCGDCGSETGYPGRCDSCDWKAKNVKGEFVIALNGKNVGHSDGTVYVFETVYEAERMASICYPGVVGVRVMQKGAA